MVKNVIVTYTKLLLIIILLSLAACMPTVTPCPTCVLCPTAPPSVGNEQIYLATTEHATEAYRPVLVVAYEAWAGFAGII